MLYVYEGETDWVVTIYNDLPFQNYAKPVPLTLSHQIRIIKGTVQFLILTDVDWQDMHLNYPDLYATMYRIMDSEKPRNGLQRTMARLRSYMNTYDALAAFYGMRNHAYLAFQGEGPHMTKPWSMFQFVRLTRKFLRERNRCWEA